MQVSVQHVKAKEDPADRTEMPKLNLDGGAASHNTRKRKASNVLELARRASRNRKAITELEEGFNAKSSRAAKKAVRATVTKIIREARSEPPGPPTTDKLKVLAAVLKQAHYRAAPQYLGEYKIMVIEEGHQWTDQLERALKLCKRSTTRALGPAKKAKEVAVMETGKVFVPAVTNKKPKVVPLARELFEFGVIWMLREIELSHVTKGHLKVDVEHRRVVLTIPVSKTDQEAQSMTRMLQCLCEGKECATGCPLRISAMLVFGMEDRNLHYCFGHVQREKSQEVAVGEGMAEALRQRDIRPFHQANGGTEVHQARLGHPPSSLFGPLEVRRDLPVRGRGP